MKGSGTGKLNGKQLFVCRKNFALFCPIESVIPEEDFLNKHPENATGRRTSEKYKIQEQIHQDEVLARSLIYYGVNTSGEVTKGCFTSVQHFVPQPCDSVVDIQSCM